MLAFRLPLLTAILFAMPAAIAISAQTQPVVDVRAYPNLQAAIDANGGRIIVIPPGTYEIDRALVISSDRTELHGPARIIQRNANENLLRIENASEVRVANLTFTRSPGNQETNQHGVFALRCRDVEFTGLHVSENHTHSSIVAQASRDIVVQDCTVINYKGPTIDDRTKSDRFGYAFKSVDGTAIQMREVDGVIIRNNRISEYRLRPTREVRDQYDLGTLTVVPDKPGRNTRQEMLDARYTNNWHQGSGIHLASPDATRRALVIGNTIEHCNQGLDIHADHVIAANNMVSHALIGLKAVHGAKNILMEGNMISFVDLWGILLRPGAASRSAADTRDGSPAVTENIDGGSLIANNIISNLGFGLQAWNWPDRSGAYGLHLGDGPLPENPPLRNLLVVGNMVHDSGQDTVFLDGEWKKVPPRYGYAAFLDTGSPTASRNVRFYGNLFDPGSKGIADTILSPTEN